MYMRELLKKKNLVGFFLLKGPIVAFTNRCYWSLKIFLGLCYSSVLETYSGISKMLL